MTDDASVTETAGERLDTAEQRSAVRKRYARIAADAGFVDVTVEPNAGDSTPAPDRDGRSGPIGTAVSVTTEAEKPVRNAPENAEN